MINVVAVVLIYAVINSMVSYLYYKDKKSAVKGTERTPEKTLLTLSFIAPFGAAAGMHIWRHKTKKSKFKIVYLFMMLHIAGIAILAWWYYL